MQNRRRTTRAGGFSLMELLCALAIVSTAGFGSLQMYNVGLEKIATAREAEIALAVLRNEMESLRAVPYEALVDRDQPMGSVPLPAELPGAEVTVRTEEAMPGLKTVTVTLRWQHRKGRWMSRALSTRMAALVGPGEADSPGKGAP